MFSAPCGRIVMSQTFRVIPSAPGVLQKSSIPVGVSIVTLVQSLSDISISSRATGLARATRCFHWIEACEGLSVQIGCGPMVSFGAKEVSHDVASLQINRCHHGRSSGNVCRFLDFCTGVCAAAADRRRPVRRKQQRLRLWIIFGWLQFEFVPQWKQLDSIGNGNDRNRNRPVDGVWDRSEWHGGPTRFCRRKCHTGIHRCHSAGHSEQQFESAVPRHPGRCGQSEQHVRTANRHTKKCAIRSSSIVFDADGNVGHIQHVRGHSGVHPAGGSVMARFPEYQYSAFAPGNCHTDRFGR